MNFPTISEAIWPTFHVADAESLSSDLFADPDRVRAEIAWVIDFVNGRAGPTDGDLIHFIELGS